MVSFIKGEKLSKLFVPASEICNQAFVKTGNESFTLLWRNFGHEKVSLSDLDFD